MHHQHTQRKKEKKKKKKRRSVNITCSRWYVICTVKRRREKAMTSPAVGCMASAPSKEEKSDDVTCSRWYAFAPPAVSCGTSHATLVDIQRTRYHKLVSRVEPHASAKSRVKRAENSAIINRRRKKGGKKGKKRR